jgi:hypothetical protein
MKKQEALYFLEAKSIPFDPRITAVKLKQFLRKYIKKNKQLEIICLGKKGKHKVLFTLPYYSDL